MKSKKFLELFSGSGTVTREFEAAGWEVFSVDVRRRKGVCMPHLRKDVIFLTPADIPFQPDVIWASPPCDTFSYAAGDLHYRGSLAMTDKAVQHIHIIKKCLAVIEELRPVYYFIENPRGRMRHNPLMLDFLSRTNGSIKTITLSGYGFPTTKPTNIFTNSGINFLPMDPFGRGAKCSRKLSDNFTKCQRQKTPTLLARAIREWCEENVSSFKGVELGRETTLKQPNSKA